MSKVVEFYFDFGSPTTFLAFYQLQVLAKRYDAKIEYKGILLGGVFKSTGNSSPVTVAPKGRYMGVDLPRFAKRYGIEYTLNPFFPVNTLPLMRGFYAAKELGIEMAYMTSIFDAMWKNKANFLKPETMSDILVDLNVDETKFQDLVTSDSIKQQLKDATEELVKRGGFGAPTMYLDDEMYFGQDRLDFIEEVLSES